MDFALTESTTSSTNGQWIKGQSGNPLGRPKKQRLVDLQRELEIAVRESLSAERIAKIVAKVAEMAEGGNLKAAKLIMDKTISNAQTGDEVDTNGGRTVIFRIENATFPKIVREQPEAPLPVIDVKVIEPIEVKHE